MKKEISIKGSFGRELPPLNKTRLNNNIGIQANIDLWNRHKIDCSSYEKGNKV